jgi:hypothetical protein
MSAVGRGLRWRIGLSYKQYTPWYRIGEPDSLGALLEEAGAREVVVSAERDFHGLAFSEDWWTMAMGGGCRGTIDQLSAEAKVRVRESCLGFLGENGVLYAIARK